MQERNPARGLLPVRQIVDDSRHLSLAQNVSEWRHGGKCIDRLRLSYPLAEPFGVPRCPDAGQVRGGRRPFPVNHVTRGAVGPQNQGGLPLASACRRRFNPDALFPQIGHDGVGLAGTKTAARRWTKPGGDHLGVTGMGQQPLLVPPSPDLGNRIGGAARPVARHAPLIRGDLLPRYRQGTPARRIRVGWGVLIAEVSQDNDSQTDQREATGHERTLQRMTVRRSEEHTSELQSQPNLVCRRLLEKKKKTTSKNKRKQ